MSVHGSLGLELVYYVKVFYIYCVDHPTLDSGQNNCSLKLTAVHELWNA